MMNMQKTRLALAVTGAVSLVALTAHAEEFTASTTLQNTLAVTNILNFDIGTVFASTTGGDNTEGVGGITISPTGVVSAPANVSASVSLISLGAPVPAQGSVDMAAEFTLTLPNTDGFAVADFTANAGGSLDDIAAAETGTTQAAELLHESGDPDVPSLWLLHFTVGDVSGGVATPPGDNTGVFSVEPDFGETTYVFNIGATVITEPGEGTAKAYQAGLYSGTFEVTAAY